MEGNGVYTIMTYLANDPLYDVEKLYACLFPIEDIPGAQASNHIFDRRRIFVRDIRGQPLHDLDKSGFTFVKAGTAFKPEEFKSYDFVREHYFQELEKVILRLFPQYSKVIYMDHNHRKRSPAFPNRAGEATKYAQPLTLPHLDFSPDSVQQRLDQVVTADGLEYLRHLPYDQLNVWRVLKGPNNDWPLAVCGYRSIDIHHDPIVSDLIFKDTASENYTLRGNKSHEWFYMSNQEIDDVLIFRNASSDGTTRPCAWYSAFDAPAAPSASFKGAGISRESMDVRLFAFRREEFL